MHSKLSFRCKMQWSVFVHWLKKEWILAESEISWFSSTGGSLKIMFTESEFNEFKPRLKSAKNRFQLSAGLNLKSLIAGLSGTKHIWSASQI